MSSMKNILFLPAVKPKFFSSTDVRHHDLAVEKLPGGVGFVHLNRSKRRTATISRRLSEELARGFTPLEKDEDVRAIVLTGGDEVFSVGGDLVHMKEQGFLGTYRNDFSLLWNRVADCSKVGGGFEIALMCDIIYAGEEAQFGQLEIKVGTTPSSGCQRLARCMKKSQVMEAVLTGRLITAQQAIRLGIVSKVLPRSQVIPEAIKLAEKVSSSDPTAVLAAKECLRFAQEASLSSGLHFERLSLLAKCNPT